jgi:hypothetical protein
MKSRGLLCCLILPAWLVSTGCAGLCIGGAVGGAAGYEGAKQGYKLQAPVQKDREGNIELHSPVTKDKEPAPAPEPVKEENL